MQAFTSPLEVSDFSKGFTDNYIEGGINGGETFDNLLIQKNNKLKSRPGRTFYISAAQAQLPAGNSRVNGLIKHIINRNLIGHTANKLYSSASGSWSSLLGPVSSNSPLGTATTSNFCSWSDYKGHTLITNDSLCDPVKVYRDNNGTYQVRTAGLPSLLLEGAIDLANALKTAYNAHRVDALEHTTAPDNTNTVSASDAYDEASLITLTNQLITKYAAHNADAALSSAWVYHAAQNATPHSLSSTSTATTVQQCADLLDDLRTKYNAHDNDDSSHGTFGSHQVSAQRTPQISSSGSASYIYYFLYYYSYYVDEVLWEDFGPTLQVVHSSASTGTKSISDIPAISNGTTRCYDTTSIKVKIYRTEDGGTVPYYVGEVTNGTTTYSDTSSDSTITSLGIRLYTEGGVLDYDAPPKAKYFVAVNDIGVYASLKIGSQNYPNSFITSIPGDIDSVPGRFQDEVELPITGISSFGIYPFIYCRNRFYRLEGVIDEQGRGVILKKEVSREKGTISNLSIVRTPLGLFFAGEDGFYYTDGFNVEPISIHLIETYKDLVSVSANEIKICGEYDSQENRVHWCVSRDSASENNAIFVLDLNKPISPESVFVTQSGYSDCFKPTALAFYNNTMVQGDSRGYVLEFDDTIGTDPKIDTSVSASSWQTYPVIYDYKSPAFNFGTNEYKKYVTIITLESRNDVNATIQINSNNNNSGLWSPLKEIRSRSLITWGDASITWGDTSQQYLWNVNRIINAKRRFPAGGIRCFLKQIQITNAYTIIYNSDVYGLGTVDNLLKTVSISGTFPTDIVDYYISFLSSNYETEYLITQRNSATSLTFSDSLNSSISGSDKWVIRGYKKGERIYVISYGVTFSMSGQLQNTWDGSDGSNA